MTTLAIIRRAMRRALQWRLLLLSPIALLVASAATLLALAQFFGGLFSHSPRWQEIAASVDSSVLTGMIKALETPAGAAIRPAVETSVVLALVFAPFLAGAALVVADSDARPRLRDLFSGAAAHYPRLLRMQLAAVIALGVAGFVAGMVLNWASHVSDAATSEGATHTSGRLALVVSILVVFVAQLVVDAGRARLAAEPARRSAVVALWAGAKLIAKRPLHTLLLGAASMVVALLVAALVLVVRQQLTQSSGAAVLLAFLLAQLAVAAIGWGHAAKLCGLVEIARDLAGAPAAAARPVAPRAEDPVAPAVTPPPDALAQDAPAVPQPRADSPAASSPWDS
jgi:hypothetical protein